MSQSLKNLLQQSINRAGITKEVQAAQVCQAFQVVADEVLPAPLRGKATALHVKNHTLTISVAHMTIGQEIKLKEFEVLEKLEKKIGRGVVTRLRFLV